MSSPRTKAPRTVKSPSAKSPRTVTGKSPRGKSPRGKSPRGKSPRGKSPRAKELAPGEFPTYIGFNIELSKVAPRPRSAEGKLLPFYALLDNGGRTFVVIHDEMAGKVAVYRNTGEEVKTKVVQTGPVLKVRGRKGVEMQWIENKRTGKVELYTINTGEFKYERVKIFTGVGKFFVGKSPKNEMTIFSGGYGPKFDGNTVLFELGGKGKYVYFCYAFEEFKPEAEIVKYVSPVGNSGVPSPFAVDKAGNLYLFGTKQAVSGPARLYQEMLDDRFTDLLNPKTKVPGVDKQGFATKTIIPRP